MTLPLVTCEAAGATWVCTVRAAATVAISAATAAAAERNFILRDIIFWDLAGSLPYEANNKVFASHKTRAAHINLCKYFNLLKEYCDAPKCRRFGG
jgi:hypothetical protein